MPGPFFVANVANADFIPDLCAKVCVITGASSGVGAEAALALARLGATVIMVCHSHERGEAARAQIRRESGNDRVELLLADFCSLRQVRSLATLLDVAYGAIHVLVNNAGVYRARREVTADGFEATLAVNHLSHFLLTNLLLRALRAGNARVITVSSGAHRMAKLRRQPLEQIMRGSGSYSGVQAYADSKLANLLFSFELARREPAVTAIALHPGMLSTRIWNQNSNALSLMMRLLKPLMEKPAKGGERVVRLATVLEFAGATGEYFDRDSRARATADAYDETLAAELWGLSAVLTQSPSARRQ